MTSRSTFNYRHSFSGSIAGAGGGPAGIVAPKPSKVAAQAATVLIGKLHDLAQDTLNKPATQKILNRIPSPVANIFKDDPDTGPSVLDHVAGLLPQKLADNLIGLQGITRVLASIVRTTAAILSWRRPHIERLIKEAQRSGDGRQVPYFSPHPPPVAVLAMAIWTLVCFHPVFLLAALPLWVVALLPTASTDLRTPRTPGSGTLRRHGMNRVPRDSSSTSSDDDDSSGSDAKDDDDLIIPAPYQPLEPPALPPRSQSVSRSSSIDTVSQSSQTNLNSSQESLLNPPPLPPRPSEPDFTQSNDTPFITPAPRMSSTNSCHTVSSAPMIPTRPRLSSHQSPSRQSTSSAPTSSASSTTLDPSFDPSWSARRTPPKASTPTPSDRSISPAPITKRATKGPTTQAVHDLLEIQSIILSSADRVRQLLAILGFDNSITRWASTVAKPPPEDMPSLTSKKSLTEHELIGQGVPLVVSVSVLSAWLAVVATQWVVPAVWAAGIVAMVVFSDFGLFYMALLVPYVQHRVEAAVQIVRGWWVEVQVRWTAPGRGIGYEPPKTKVGKLVHALGMEVAAVVKAVSVGWAYGLLFWWANLAFDVRRVVMGSEACTVVDDEDEEEQVQRRWLLLDDADMMASGNEDTEQAQTVSSVQETGPADETGTCEPKHGLCCS